MADQRRRVDLCQRAPGRLAPPRAIPARRQRRADVTDLAADQLQPAAMEPPTQVQGRPPVPVPGPDHHARLVPRDPDRQRQRVGIPRQLEDQIGAPRTRQRRPLRGAVDDRARPPGPGSLGARWCRLGGRQQAQGKARQQRGGQQPDHTLADHQHRVAQAGRPVQDQVHRGLHVRIQHRPLGRQIGRDHRQLPGRSHERAGVGLECEHAPSHQLTVHPSAHVAHNPHRRVAIAKGIAKGRVDQRAQRLVGDQIARQLAPERQQLGPGAQRRNLGLDQRLVRRRSRQRFVTQLDAVGRGEEEGAAMNQAVLVGVCG